MNPAKKAMAQAMSRLLADSYTLYLKTHNFHWNVTGPMFTSLHNLFELQYTELATAVDVLAERIRTFGFRAPGSYAEFAAMTAISESTDTPSAEVMIHALAEDQNTLVKTAKAVFEAATAAGDDVTADLAIQRMDVHQKNEWMLRSHLEQPGGLQRA